MSLVKLFVMVGLSFCLASQPVQAQEATTEEPPAATFTVAPDAPVTVGVTEVEAGDVLQLDLEQLSSENVKVQLVNEQGEAEVLAETPLLTDSIGLSVEIPIITESGRYNLEIIGVEKGEKITLPLQVKGLIDDKTDDTLQYLALGVVILLGIIGLWFAIKPKRRKKS